MRDFHVSVVMLALALSLGFSYAHADNQKLRILSWADYVPADLIAAFKKETGIDVEVTLSNNEEMISKLRATGGAGYDLAQPSQDRIASVTRDFGIYKTIDLSKVKTEEFQPALLEIVKRNATVDGKLYGLPYLWGTDGLVVNTKRAKVADSRDLCNPELKGKTAIRLRRPTLMAFAFASGKDPFALYGDPKAYGALMDQVGATLIACKPNFKFFYDNKDQLLNGFRSGEVTAAMMWDTGGWTLNRDNPDIQYVVARSGGSTPSPCRRAAATMPRPTRGSTSPCGRRMPRKSSSRWETSRPPRTLRRWWILASKRNSPRLFPRAN